MEVCLAASTRMTAEEIVRLVRRELFYYPVEKQIIPLAAELRAVEFAQRMGNFYSALRIEETASESESDPRRCDHEGVPL